MSCFFGKLFTGRTPGWLTDDRDAPIFVNSAAGATA